MQAVIRKYSGRGANDLFDVLEKNSAEIKSALRSVAGFVSYMLARTSEGGFSVTVCQDTAGIDESVSIAKEWISKNAAGIGAAAPEVITGSVIIQTN